MARACRRRSRHAHAPGGDRGSGAGPSARFAGTTTSGDGSFRFARLPLGVYDLSADNVTIAGLALDGVGRRGIKLSLGSMRAGPARIEGRVPGSAPGRAVTLSGEAGLHQTVLDANEAFSFAGLAAGTYRLALDGIGAIRENVTLAPGGLFKLIFPLGSSIRGQVLDPPPGAVAVLHAPPAWRWSRQCPLESTSARTPEGSVALPSDRLPSEGCRPAAIASRRRGSRWDRWK